MSGYLSFHAGSRHTTYAASLAGGGDPDDSRGGWLHTTIVPGLSYLVVEEAFWSDPGFREANQCSWS
jgi:hypothetical protein